MSEKLYPKSQVTVRMLGQINRQKDCHRKSGEQENPPTDTNGGCTAQ